MICAKSSDSWPNSCKKAKEIVDPKDHKYSMRTLCFFRILVLFNAFEIKVYGKDLTKTCKPNCIINHDDLMEPHFIKKHNNYCNHIKYKHIAYSTYFLILEIVESFEC